MAQQGFDLRTQIRDPKTGQITKSQPYVFRTFGGTQIFTRDGRNYTPDGKEVVSREEEKKRVESERKALLDGKLQEVAIAKKRASKAEEQVLILEIALDEETKRENGPKKETTKKLLKKLSLLEKTWKKKLKKRRRFLMKN